MGYLFVYPCTEILKHIRERPAHLLDVLNTDDDLVFLVRHASLRLRGGLAAYQSGASSGALPSSAHAGGGPAAFATSSDPAAAPGSLLRGLSRRRRCRLLLFFVTGTVGRGPARNLERVLHVSDSARIHASGAEASQEKGFLEA